MMHIVAVSVEITHRHYCVSYYSYYSCYQPLTMLQQHTQSLTAGVQETSATAYVAALTVLRLHSSNLLIIIKAFG
jgi:hypothetical protein